MILLDSDHVSLLKYPESERGHRLLDRLTAFPPSEVAGVAIVTVEERMRGWGRWLRKPSSSRRTCAISSRCPGSASKTGWINQGGICATGRRRSFRCRGSGLVSRRGHST